MKGKKIAIIAVGVVVVVLLAVSIFILSSKKSTPSQVEQQPGSEIQAIPTVAAGDIGLSLKMGADGKRVIMQIANTKNIKSVDYELDYTSTGGISRGTMGHADVKNGNPVKQEIVLGTCSDVCHYDQDVSDIKLIVKVTKSDDKIYQTQISPE